MPRACLHFDIRVESCGLNQLASSANLSASVFFRLGASATVWLGLVVGWCSAPSTNDLCDAQSGLSKCKQGCPMSQTLRLEEVSSTQMLMTRIVFELEGF